MPIASYRSLRDLDWTILVVALILCGLGVLQIYSATLDTIFRNLWWKQLLALGLGFAGMLVISQTDYHSWLGRVPALYIAGIVLTVATLLFGQSEFGAKAWLRIGGVTIQPSEFVKLVLILLVSRFLTEVKSDRLETSDLIRLGALTGVPTLLVMKEDLGTALTFVPIVAGCVFVAGIRLKHFVVLAAAAAILLPASWLVLKDHQKARLSSFLDPERDPRGQGYQVIQSKIAVGQGGVWGRGVTHGSQTQLGFLPVRHNDFIFAAFAEEHGFIGVVLALGLYLLLLLQVIQNAQMAPDRAGLYICMGVGSLLLFHLLVNVGMVVGRMPVTGIPLPLMSSGGSSLLSVFMMLGLVQSVRLRRFVN